MLTLDLYWETKLHTEKWFLKSLSHTRCHQSPPLAMAKPSSETLCASIRTPGPIPTPGPRHKELWRLQRPPPLMSASQIHGGLSLGLEWCLLRDP